MENSDKKGREIESTSESKIIVLDPPTLRGGDVESRNVHGYWYWMDQVMADAQVEIARNNAEAARYQFAVPAQEHTKQAREESKQHYASLALLFSVVLVTIALPAFGYSVETLHVILVLLAVVIALFREEVAKLFGVIVGKLSP